MLTIISPAIITTALLLCAIGCDNKDYSNASPFDNVVYLDAAKLKDVSNFTFNRTIETGQKEISALLARPAGEDINVGIKVDASLVNTYNARLGANYTMLDAKHYKLSAGQTVIPQGEVSSKPVTIDFSGLTDLEIDAGYLLPITIDQVSGGMGTLGGSKTICYVVRRSSAITTAMNLKNVYVAVPGFDKGSPTADVVNNLTAITMETIIRINQFDDETDISSIMGIEQYLCVRLGDVDFPRQQLQVQTPVGKFPTADKKLQLQAGEWYHIALTWDLNTQVIAFYVNGKLQSREEGHGKSDVTTISLGDKLADNDTGNGGDFNFYFGRSYGQSNDISRQLNGDICEARIWSVARTEQQIYENMYNIDDPAAESDLQAYWKFDEGTGNTIIDRTGHHNDAKMIPYFTDDTYTQPRPKTEAELWPSGVEVPIMNK